MSMRYCDVHVYFILHDCYAYDMNLKNYPRRMYRSDDWWRVRWEAAGFVYSEFLTKKSQSIAMKDQQLKNLTLDMRDDHLYFVGQHIYLNVQVFINPMVASLPEHSHLFAEVSMYTV